MSYQRYDEKLSLGFMEAVMEKQHQNPKFNPPKKEDFIREFKSETQPHKGLSIAEITELMMERL